MTYTELFDYFKAEREQIFSAFEKMPFEDLSKNRELSFLSIKDTFLHTIDVEDGWLHYTYRRLPVARPNHENFKDLVSMRKRASEVDQKTAQLFKEIKPSDLSIQTFRQYPNGNSSTQTLEQILYHIPIEVIHHYGEIFGEFWKMNMEAPYYSFLRFQTRRQG